MRSMYFIPLSLNQSFTSCDLPNDKSFEKCDCSDFRKGGFDMKVEQTRDDDISEIRSMILNGKESKDVQKHYLLVDDLLYYFSSVNDDPCLRLFIPKHIRNFVVKQYHNQNGHIGVQKTFDSIRQKCYWPNMFKEINKYVSECTICQTRSLQKIRPQEQHKSFVTVRNHLRKAKKRQAKYADRGTKEIEYKIGDPVYYKILEKKNLIGNIYLITESLKRKVSYQLSLKIN